MVKVREFGEYLINALIVAGLPSYIIIYLLNEGLKWAVPYWPAWILVCFAVGYQYDKGSKK